MVVNGHPACKPDSGEFCIDTLSLTFDLSVIAHHIDSFTAFDALAASLDSGDFSDDFTVCRAVLAFARKLFPANSIELHPEVKGGRNMFDHRIDFKDACGFIAFGGNNIINRGTENETKVRQRLQVYITGEGCRRVHDFEYLRRQIETFEDYAPKITRIDIAYDDHAGHRNLELCENMYMRGMFKGNGRPPKARKIDDFGSGDGCSMYIGSKKSGKELNCYEKGKEQGDSDSQWVRWEGRIYAQDRVIPLDILTDYPEYLTGMYPATKWMGRAASVIKTAKLKERIQYNHLREHAKISYGPLIHYMKAKGLTDSQIVAELIVTSKFPSRIEWASFDHPDIEPLISERPLPVEKTHPHLFGVNHA